MDPQAGLPQLYYPQDPLRAGLTHLKDAATPHHPLETALKQVCTARSARPRPQRPPARLGPKSPVGRRSADARGALRLWQAEAQKADTKKSLLRNTQGMHMAMRLNMEQTILSQYRRLPGFHSEFTGLEIMQDSMSNVGVQDILNDPRESMEAPIAMHEGMERLLGVAPVEPFHHAVSRPTLAMRPL
jgi:hypothetical protein